MLDAHERDGLGNHMTNLDDFGDDLLAPDIRPEF